MSNSELYHHGILGMKWGIRRFQNKDGSYTSEGKKRKLSNFVKNPFKKDSVDATGKNKFQLTDKQKKALKIGAAIAGAALVTYGAYKLSEINYNKNYSKYEDLLRKDAVKANSRFRTYFNFDDNRNKSVDSKDPLLSNRQTSYGSYRRSDKMARKLDNSLYSRIRNKGKTSPEIETRYPVVEEYKYNPRTSEGYQRVLEYKKKKVRITK